MHLTSSVVPVQPLSIVDLAVSSNYKKQTVQLALDRIITHLSEKAKKVRESLSY